jgi:hypothetical protein
MSTPTDNFKSRLTLTLKKITKRRAAAERVSLSAGFSGQKGACRLGKQQSKWLCSALGSPATARPLQGGLHQSPTPKSTKPCFSGHTISHQVEGHVKTHQESACAQLCAVERAQQRAQEAKGACLGGPAPQACPLFAWRGNFTVVVREGPKDTKSTHRAHGSIFWRPRRAHTEPSSRGLRQP